jgi:hypothetical protein
MSMSRRGMMRRLGASVLLLSAERVSSRAGEDTFGAAGDSDLQVTLIGAITRRGRAAKERSDLELDLRRRGGTWESEAWGFAAGFNTSDHFGPVRVRTDAGGLTVETTLTVGSDLWVPGGTAKYTVTLKRTGPRLEGTYSGAFGDDTVSGKAVGTFDDPWPVPPPSGFVPLAAREHPRLIFRRSDYERLRERAASDWGRAVVERLRRLLAEPFVYAGDYGANSAYFAAGHAFLHWLTGDAGALEFAREITTKSLRTVPTNKGHLYAYSHHLMGLSLAYDLCASAWEPAFTREVVRYLEETSALVIAGKQSAFNHGPGSNWVARTRGAAGMALVAIQGDPGASARVPHLLRITERSLARYLMAGAGEQGFGVEGDGYYVESMEMIFGLLQAYRTAYGQEMARGTGAERTLPLYILRSFPNTAGQATVARYGRHGGPTGAVPGTLFGLGLGSVPVLDRPALRHFYDHYWGLRGDRSFGIDAPHVAVSVLAHYPADVPPRPPDDVLPRAVHDRRKGFVLFRNREVVTTVYAKSDPVGWNFPDAGTFRIQGFGTDWAVRAGVSTREMENVTRPVDSTIDGNGRGRVTYFEAKPDGSGAVRMDLDGVYLQGSDRRDVGIRSARSLLVDYSGVRGGGAVFFL